MLFGFGQWRLRENLVLFVLPNNLFESIWKNLYLTFLFGKNLIIRKGSREVYDAFEGCFMSRFHIFSHL